MTRILITGGLGFVGSNVTVSLLNCGYDVIIIDSLINSSEERLSDINNSLKLCNSHKMGKLFFMKLDIRNSEDLNRTFIKYNEKNNPIKAVIHCAGIKSVVESVSDPLSYWDVNIKGTLSLLSIMKLHKCHTLIFSSSASVYSQNINTPVTEKSLLKPITPYGNTKLSIELMIEDLYKSDPGIWRISNLRYFNPAGSNIEGLLGEEPQNTPNNLFPIILDVINKKLDKLHIYGNNWPTKDGTCIRDFIHILDLSEAHLATLNYLFKNKPQMLTLNIGTGLGTSVLEVVNTFNEIDDVNVPFQFDKKRKGDVPFMVACNNLALNTINWHPKRTIKQICIDCLKTIKL